MNEFDLYLYSSHKSKKMIKSLLKSASTFGAFVFLVCISFTLKAQDNVGIGTNTPDASAILEMLSTNKGMLVPRMNTAGMNLIASPANSLIIYNTDSMCYFFYRQPTSQWVSLCKAGAQGATGPAGPIGPAGPAGQNGTALFYYPSNSALLNTDISVNTTTWTAMSGMTLTYTPTKTSGVLMLSVAGFRATDFMATYVGIRVKVNGTVVKGTSTTCGDIDKRGVITSSYVVTPWNAQIIAPITTVVGVPTTITVEWMRDTADHSAVQVVCYPTTEPDINHRSVMIME